MLESQLVKTKHRPDLGDDCLESHGSIRFSRFFVLRLSFHHDELGGAPAFLTRAVMKNVGVKGMVHRRVHDVPDVSPSETEVPVADDQAGGVIWVRFETRELSSHSLNIMGSQCIKACTKGFPGKGHT